ncbi:MAG: glutamate--tRNA ligase [Methylobacterium sp.]|nr:glutamate--tRNA ligase [Methylobacterium sp.]MCA3658369.1 glutamate--tRNA ligase [Methylobacterium sp.]MCA3661682.1 glutamate--tRNA ligase [Methylobacterium sp.]MCA3662940.1 glutamate--tRNA ligase [Methylobacterium sp.]MCA3665868.1 glutamate--tRNA ligase [Methylobacterium sp.]
MSDPIITRFAPSPTGFLHIGGARTALFNWLLARRHGGKMLLRIEDTDRVRSTPEAIDAIIDGLKWLGLSWDGDVIYQFARAPRHKEVAEAMLANGRAYKCYATSEELEAMREAAKAAGKPMRYDGRWRDKSPEDHAKAEAEGRKYVIRLKAPLGGQTIVQDLVQGTVTWDNENLDDLVLLRSDGTPTYMLAVVVDDHDMGVTHIIRGDDHLTNAARQTQIYEANGWKVPQMAHIPLIHGPDGAKLSKRHGALGVDAYRALGYLPEALRNYLVRLGWAHGDQEIFSTDEMTAVFDLRNVGRSPARFDFAKLESINGHYMRKTDDAALLAALRPVLAHVEGGEAIAAALTPEKEAQWIAAMPGLKERAKTLVELIDGSRFLFAARPLVMDEKARDILAKDGKAILARLLARLEAVPLWETASLEEAVRAEAESSGLKLGALAQPLRAALTGRATSPGIFEVLVVLGREECLGRLRDQAA